VVWRFEGEQRQRLHCVHFGSNVSGRSIDRQIDI